MIDPNAIADDDIILRRISPGEDKIKKKSTSAFRATSFAIQPLPGEEWPSWSRQSITSAQRLIEIEAATRPDMSGWSIAAVRVGEVRALGLEVESSPTQDDPGHCQIVPKPEQSFTKRVWSQLAKKTEIVYPPAASIGDQS